MAYGSLWRLHGFTMTTLWEFDTWHLQTQPAPLLALQVLPSLPRNSQFHQRVSLGSLTYRSYSSRARLGSRENWNLNQQSMSWSVSANIMQMFPVFSPSNKRVNSASTSFSPAGPTISLSTVSPGSAFPRIAGSWPHPWIQMRQQLFTWLPTKKHWQNHQITLLRVIPTLTYYFCILSSSLSGICSDILSGILSVIYSGILSGICSDILSGILSDILRCLSDILFGTCSGPGALHSIRSFVPT